ncbi:MAG: hypothetical protein WD690_05900 [Vicinamibacterales bacterium]
MQGSLDTTNTMLAIIAAVSVVQGLVLLGLGVAGWKIYRAATETLREIDEKRVKPLAAKVDSILDQVHRLTDRVQHRAEKFEAVIDETVNRVNHTTTGVKSTVADSVHRVSDAVTSIRSLIVNALTTGEGSGHRHHSRFARESTHVPRTEPAGGHVHHEETRRVQEGGL